MSNDATSAVPSTTHASVTRRAVVKGAAWAVPVITVGAAAPAMAASPVPPRGLNGWVQLEKLCGDDRFNINGSGSYDDRGLWVFISDPSATIGPASISFYFQSNTLSWTNSSGAGWSNLTRDASADDPSLTGFYAYTTTYTGTWTYVNDTNDAEDRWEADTDPYFYRVLTDCLVITAYARRTVRVVSGGTETNVSFRRGPVTV